MAAGVQILLAIALTVGWLFAAGIGAALSGTFGSIGGWAFAIGYLLLPTGILTLGWPFRGRRIVAAIGVVLSVAGGLAFAHSATYTGARIRQVMRSLPQPQNAKLINSETEDGCFGPCPNVHMTYLVPVASDAASRYESSLLHKHFHVIQQDPELYLRGHLGISVTVDTGSEVPPTFGAPPAGYEYLLVDASNYGN